MSSSGAVKRSADDAGLDASEGPDAIAPSPAAEATNAGAPPVAGSSSSALPSAASQQQLQQPSTDAEPDGAGNELQRALEQVERERQELQSGGHGIFKERCAVFESVRADSIARAVSQREFQLKSVEKMFEYQTYAADRICENSKVELMGNMLKELQERQDLIQARLSGQEARPEARSQRTLRSKRGKAEEAAGVGADQKGAGAAAGVPEPGQAAAQAITVALKSEEALSDMKAIYRDWKAVAQRWRQVNATALLPARVERNKLYYANDSYVKGDPVVVFSELTKQEFLGRIFALAVSEALVRLEDGTKIRIPLQHLRHGRVSLYRHTITGQPAAALATSGGGAAGASGSADGAPDNSAPGQASALAAGGAPAAGGAGAPGGPGQQPGRGGRGGGARVVAPTGSGARSSTASAGAAAGGGTGYAADDGGHDGHDDAGMQALGNAFRQQQQGPPPRPGLLPPQSQQQAQIAQQQLARKPQPPSAMMPPGSVAPPSRPPPPTMPMSTSSYSDTASSSAAASGAAAAAALAASAAALQAVQPVASGLPPIHDPFRSATAGGSSQLPATPQTAAQMLQQQQSMLPPSSPRMQPAATAATASALAQQLQQLQAQMSALPQFSAQHSHLAAAAATSLGLNVSAPGVSQESLAAGMAALAQAQMQAIYAQAAQVQQAQQQQQVEPGIDYSSAFAVQAVPAGTAAAAAGLAPVADPFALPAASGSTSAPMDQS